MKIDYLTLFPEMFEGVLNHSILKRAQDKGIINVNTINFRDYSVNK
ncbi:tRNA (guanosine(37)-N1)-methyltransferase TrmD, partial [Bacillus cereus]